MKKVGFLTLIIIFFLGSLHANEVNVFSARHYDSDIQLYEKFTAKKYKAYMIEDYLYIYNANGLGYINVRGVFEDPEDLALFDCDGNDCYDDDAEFPIPMDMLQTITQGIMSGELMMLATSTNDTTNDTLQDQGRPSAPKQQQG